MQNDHETRFIGTRASPSSYGARFIVLAGRCDAIDSEWAGLFFISQSAHFVFRIMLINKSIYVIHFSGKQIAKRGYKCDGECE